MKISAIERIVVSANPDLSHNIPRGTQPSWERNGRQKKKVEWIFWWLKTAQTWKGEEKIAGLVKCQMPCPWQDDSDSHGGAVNHVIYEESWSQPSHRVLSHRKLCLCFSFHRSPSSPMWLRVAFTWPATRRERDSTLFVVSATNGTHFLQPDTQGQNANLQDE